MGFINDFWATILMISDGEDAKNHIESIRRCEDLFEAIRSLEIQNGKLTKRNIALEVFEVKQDMNTMSNQSDQLFASTANDESNKKAQSFKTRNKNLSKSFLKNYDNEADDINDNDYDEENVMMEEEDIIDGAEEDLDEEDDYDSDEKKSKKRSLPQKKDIYKAPLPPSPNKSKQQTNAKKFLLSKLKMK
jgi:hypothetical protein